MTDGYWKKAAVFCLIIIVQSTLYCFADTASSSSSSSAKSSSENTTPVPYAKDEFPAWANSARRGEIIAFGSLPFVTLATTLAYSFYRYYKNDFSTSYIPNPFAKSSDSANLDTTEQMGILKASVCISLGLGISDMVYNIIKHKNEEKRKLTAYQNSPIVIEAVNEQADMMNGRPPPDMEHPESYLYGGIQSAVF